MEKKEATTSAQPTVPVVRKSIFAKKKASADTPSHQQVTTTSNPTSSAPEQLPPSLVAAAGVDGTSAADAPHVEVAVSSAPIQPVKRRSLFGRKVQTTTSVKDDVVLTTTPVVITQAPPATTMAADEEEDANITPPATSTPHTLSIGSGAVVAERAEDSEDRTTTTATALDVDDQTAVTKLSSAGVVVMAESDSSFNSTDRPQTPAMPQSITLSRYMMRVCEITGRLIPVLGEKIGAGASSGSAHHHHNHQQQSGMMGMTESSSTGGDDDNDEAGVFNNNLPPMLAYLHYLPYSHYMDAPVPRALLRTRATNMTTTTMTVNNCNINVNGNDEGEQLPQSVRPLSRLVVGLVDTTLGGAVMADATTAQSMTCHEASRPTSPSTRTPLGNNNVHATSSFAEGGGFVESRGKLIGTKRSRNSLDGGAGAETAEEGGAADIGDGQQHPSSLPPRPMSPQALNTSFGTTTSVSGGGVAAAGSCPSSLYSPGYPSTTTHTSTLLGSQQNKHHIQNSSSTVGNNPFYVPVGFGVVPPNVVCRAIQEPVYLTLRFEKCLAACYTVCAKVVPEMQLGWSVHSTTMFYCHVFIRAHFWQDPESQQQRSGSNSCSPRRRNVVGGGGGGRNTASSPTTANPSTTATPTKPTTPTGPPPSFYDVPSTNHNNNNNKPSPSISQQQTQPQAPVEIKRIQTMDPIILVAAALFLATKIENFKKPLDDIIGRIFDRHPNRPEHAKYKAMVLQAEIMLLATLGGNLTVIHPFDEIRQLSMGNQEVAKRANKLYSYTTMTPVALYVPRRELAASLVLLVAEEAKLLPSTSVPSSSVPRSSSVRSASGNRPPSSSANPFARLLNGDATTMTAADIDAGIPRPVALTAAHFETVMACLSAMMLVTEKKSGVARLDNRVQVKKSLIAHSEYNSRLQRNNTNNTKK